MNGNVARIEDFCKVGSGTTPSRKKGSEYFGGHIPWVKSGELKEKVIETTEETITERALKETSLRLVPRGALLVAMYGANVGRVGILGIDATTNQAICHIVPDPRKADRRYLFHALQDRTETFLGLAVGGAQPNISQQIVRGTEIFLPPVAEQRRIAAILDQADALRAKRREALAKLDEMAQAIFVEMFGDPASGVEKYPSQNLAEVSELINGDRSSNYPSGDDLVSHGVPFFSTKNIRGANFELSKCNFITEQKFKSLSRGKLQRHDLVITLRGTLGQCAEFDCEFETGFINAQMMIIRPRKELLPGYVREFISNPHTQAKLQRGSSGSAIPQLTAKQVGELSIPVPPLDIQRLFFQSLSHLAGVVNQCRESARNTENFFTSLQHRAFSGTL